MRYTNFKWTFFFKKRNNQNPNKPQENRIVIEADRSGEPATLCLYAYYLAIDFWGGQPLSTTVELYLKTFNSDIWKLSDI